MANFLTLLSLACVVVSCLAGNVRSKRAALSRSRRQVSNQQCPQSDGQFTVDDGTCTSFFTCESGNFMGVTNCPARLQFDSNSGRCEREVQGCPTDPANQICASNRNPGNPAEAFKVAHSDYCNVFFTCENNYALDTCEVCANGTYFSETLGFCAALTPGQQPQECANKGMVLDAEVPEMRLRNRCHIFDKDLFDELLQRYYGNGGGPSLNQRQFGGK